MTALIISAIVSALGIVAWFLKWKYDLKLSMQRELEEIPGKIVEQERLRDEGLKNNDADSITSATNSIRVLRDRKKYLLQRLGPNTVG